MAPTYQGTALPTCYATCSIDYDSSHDLPSKLRAISASGFQSIELSMPDILSHASQLHGSEPSPKDFDKLVSTATSIRKLCADNNLSITMLQPFANFEGWKRDDPEQESKRKEAWERARGWRRIMEAAGTDMLQVGSSDAPGISMDLKDSARDLAELADFMAEKGMRVCYENWCWSTHAPNWKDVNAIVGMADRPNLGLCLDTFQSAGGEWADPTASHGLVHQDKEVVEKQWKESLQEMARTVKAEKVFILQISDAYRMDPPIGKEDGEDGLRPRGRWSHDFRPLPYDGGHLPIVDFLRATLDTGYRGVLSIEVFDGKEGDKYKEMEHMGEAAMKGLERMCKEAENMDGFK